MDTVMTPQPHLIPGYTGHCPQYRFRPGKTYGKLSHKLLIDPCVNHAPQLIVSPTDRTARILEYPTQAQRDVLLERQRFVDAVYCDPIIPGYEGFVPNVTSKIGQRFLVAATAGMVEHEHLMNLLRCRRRNLEHRDLLESGRGKFDPKLPERLMPRTAYRSPLIPVKNRSQAINILDCSYKEKTEPYSKFTTPHFMVNDDQEKYIISGYAGHIPLAAVRFGDCSKKLTNDALCEFSNIYHQRLRTEWCPTEEEQMSTPWCPIDKDAASPCPNSGHFVIYHQNVGVIPHYGGHVPGESFAVGRTFGDSTRDAKGWLAAHKDKGKLY